MAYDRIEPPHLWESAMSRMLYDLVCAWAGKKPPKYSDYFPRQKEEVRQMSDEQIMAAFGVGIPR
jgi:hypothetical protein